MKQFLDLYHEHRPLLEGHAPAALNARREAAAQAVEEYVSGGTRRDERFKYLDVRALLEPEFGINLTRIVPQVDPFRHYRCAVPGMTTLSVYIVNDVPFISATAREAVEAVGGRLCTFTEAATCCPELLEKYYDRTTPCAPVRTPVAELNTLLCQEGLLFYLPAGARLEVPLQIVQMTTATCPVLCVPRLLMVAEAEAEASVLLCAHSESAVETLALGVQEVFLHPRARVYIYGVEETGEKHTRLCHLRVQQAEKSTLSVVQTTLSCGTSRTTTDVRLAGAGAEATMSGAVVADAAQRVDQNLLIAHEAPACNSDMLYKYVLGGESTGAWAGKVYVAPGAQQTSSQQTHANLCTTSSARALSQPMLEIYADDVKCNHGSTTGKLDEGALFYMRQRGIAEQEARLLLQHAFVAEVLARVPIEALRLRLSALVDQRFRGGEEACAGCTMHNAQCTGRNA